MLARSRDLEPQFRRTYLEQNVGRATVSTAIFLALIAIVTALDVAHGRVGGDVFHWVLLLRLGVACPALVLILCVLELRALHSH